MGENLYKTVGEFTPDKLIASMFVPLIAKGITVAKGEGILKRGTLLGVANDKTYKRTDTTETIGEGGGAEVKTIGADCILCDDVDATDAEVVTTAYVSGEFNRDAVILPEGKKIEDHETELRKLGLLMRHVQEY